nr:hypothetical protein [Hypericibacter terrae]
MNSIEFRDTGVVLDVIPRVNAGGLVVLDIAQEVSDAVETTSSTLKSPRIRQRRIGSTVAAQGGQTIALESSTATAGPTERPEFRFCPTFLIAAICSIRRLKRQIAPSF